MSLRNSLLVVAVVLSAGALALSAAYSHPAPDPNTEARINLAKSALAELDERARTLIDASGSDPKYYLWSRRIIDTLRDSGAKRGDLIAALEEHLTRMKKVEAIGERETEAGLKTHVDILDAKYAVLEAEAWLEKAKSQ
jgi:hypothetical protein